LDRIDEAVAAFDKYEAMFAETDPTAAQYAHTARHFTRQIESLGLVDGAVYIYQVAENSPAAEAGLAAGDIVVDFNKQPITNIPDIQTALQYMPVGMPIEITILRLDEQNVFHRQTITMIAQNPLGIGLMPI
jgi:S1-C subfamily serine protease